MAVRCPTDPPSITMFPRANAQAALFSPIKIWRHSESATLSVTAPEGSDAASNGVSITTQFRTVRTYFSCKRERTSHSLERKRKVPKPLQLLLENSNNNKHNNNNNNNKKT